MVKRYTIDDLFRRIPDLENKTLLDVGASGDPYYSLSYLKVLAERDLNLEDYRENIIIFDKRDNRQFDQTGQIGNFHNFVWGDLEKLPFQDEKFDIIALGRVLQCVHPEKAIEEAARVLKPEGYLIGDVPLHNNRSLYICLWNIKHWMKYPNEFIEKLGILTDFVTVPRKKEKYKRLMEKNGFLVYGDVGCEYPNRYSNYENESILRDFYFEIFCQRNFYFVAQKIKQNPKQFELRGGKFEKTYKF